MMLFRVRCLGVAMPLVASLIVGCGSDPEHYEIVPVSGILTCEGQPVANAMVNFTPIADESRKEGRPGRLALGRTDETGHFTLTTYENNDGAIVGRHVVTVSAGFDESAGEMSEFSCSASSKEVTVEAGMDDIKIDF